MLSTWNAENINHLGPSQRGGGKTFKALGDAGQGSSENPPPPSGKSMLQNQQQQQQQQRKLKPLGSYSENAPPSAAKAKGKAGGLGPLPTSSSKPQQKQRRALGDISNAGKLSAGGSGNALSKLSGKQPTPGLSFTVHSDSGKVGGTGVTKARGSGPRVAAAAVKGRSVVWPEEHVDDVELVLGRTGDEEEVLVERRAEQRAATAAASALKYATGSRSRSRSRSQSTSSAFAKPSKSTNSSGSTSKTRFGRDITNTAAAGGGPAAAACGVAACGAGGAGALDKSLDSAIDRICLNDFEDGKMELASGGKEESARTLLEDDGGMEMDMDSLTMALEGQNLDALPDGLVDDDGFLTQEMDLCLSFV